MKRKINKVYFLGLFVFLMSVMSINLNAATITNAPNLNMPSATYTGTFVEGNNAPRYYKFTIATSGHMKVDLMSEFYQRVLLLSANGDELESSDRDINDSGVSHQELNYYLEAGTYYIGFGALRGLFITTDPYGYFKFTTSFTPDAVTENGNNDSMFGANRISVGQNVKGMFAVKQGGVDKDFYVLTVNNSLFTLSAQSQYGFAIGIYATNGDQVYHDRIGVSYDTKIASVNKDISLTAGTYYIMIEPRYGGDYGLYDLKLNYSNFAPGKPSTPYCSAYNSSAVKISWNSVKDATGYTLYQKKGSRYVAIKNTTATSYTVKKLKSGSAFVFRVRAYVVVNGKKNYSPYSDVCYTATKPANTKITKIKKGKSKKYSYGKTYKATVYWKKVSGATSYKLYYRVSGSKYKTYVATYRGTKATVTRTKYKYGTTKRTVTFYVVPQKSYKNRTYTGSYSNGKKYTFK